MDIEANPAMSLRREGAQEAAAPQNQRGLFDALPQRLIEDALVPVLDHKGARLAFAQTCRAAHRAHLDVAVLQHLTHLKTGIDIDPGAASASAQGAGALGPMGRSTAAQKRSRAIYALSRLQVLIGSRPGCAGSTGSHTGGHVGSVLDALQAIGAAAMAATDASRWEFQAPSGAAARNLSGSFCHLGALLTQPLDAWVERELTTSTTALAARSRTLNGIRSRRSTLDLRGLELASLPPIADYLPFLRALKLRFNHLVDFPDALESLKNLISLDLAVNEIAVVPAQIGLFTSLTTLNLASNNLFELPAELGNLCNLQVLNLQHNHLVFLPPEIHKLKNLKTLNLAANDLAQLPPQIGELTSLKFLDVAGNELTQLPIEIDELRSLRMLDVSDNALTQLTLSFANMPLLTRLYLDRNAIDSLGTNIGKLISLKVLSLWGTRVKSLPAEVKQLPIKRMRLPQTISGFLFSDYFETASNVRTIMERVRYAMEQRAIARRAIEQQSSLSAATSALCWGALSALDAAIEQQVAELTLLQDTLPDESDPEITHFHSMVDLEE